MPNPSITTIVAGMRESLEIAILTDVILEQKRREAAEAGTLRMVGLCGHDPLVEEAIKEATQVVRNPR